MDGVLIDSEPLHYEANRILLLNKFNIELKYEYYKQFIGSTVKYLWEKMKNDFGIDGYTAEELKLMADEIKEELIDTDGYEQIEGVAEFVCGLSDHYKLAVASSSYLKNIKRNMDNLGITDEFEQLVSGTEVENPKPSPDIFLEAAKRLGVKPCECLVIEDSKNGVLAAKNAGMACLGFINPNSGNQDLSKADYLFESYEGIDENFLHMVHAHCFDEPYIALDTDRLNLREMQKEDAKDPVCKELIKEALNLENITDTDLEKYIIDYRNNSYKFLGFGLWVAQLKESDEVIGIVGIDRKVNGDFELGYFIEENHRRQGYAYEASAEIMDYIRDFGLDSVNITVKKENVASIRLAEKLMFDEFYSNDEYIFMDKKV